MTYQLQEIDAEGNTQVELVYDNGQKQVVSADQDLYLLWLSQGNTPETVSYVVPEPYVPPPRSTEITDAYILFATEWQHTELQMPSTYEQGIALLDTWYDQADTIEELRNRSKILQKLALWRTVLELKGGSWADFLIWTNE